jgi:hypothetical protein
VTEADPEGQELRTRLWRWAGFALGVLAAVLLAGLFAGGGLATAGVLTTSGPGDGIGVFLLAAAFGVGLTQFFWVVPIGGAALFFPRARGFALGLVVGAVVVFLLNAACFGVVMNGLSY